MSRRHQNARTAVIRAIAGSTSMARSGRMRPTKSTTDPDARLCRKGPGKEARLSYMGQALMENRHGMLVDFQITTATGTAERDMLPHLINDARLRGFHPRPLGADKGYDTLECVRTLRAHGVPP